MGHCIMKVQQPKPAGVAPVTGLQFASSVIGQSCGAAPAAVWLGANVIPITDATYIWRTNLVQQPSYYSQFFRSGNFGGVFEQDTGYYGCCPFPLNGSSADTEHLWEVSIDFTDPPYFPSFPGSVVQVQYGREYVQAAVATLVGGKVHIDFYYDILGAGGFANVFSYTSTNAWVQKGTDCLIWGNNPWPDPQSEALSGWTRAWEQYTVAMTTAEIAVEITKTSNVPLTPRGAANVWFLNINPTPSDISDKSGAGHHPTWQNAARPTLYTA